MTEDKMPFMSHLTELRKRIFVSLIAVIIGFVACFMYSEDIFKFLLMPMREQLSFKTSYPFVDWVPYEGNQVKLIFLAPAEAFWAHMKISLVAGVLLALPVLFAEVWRFVSPGLLKKEKKYVLPFVFVTSTLFLAGAMFCFFVVLPFAMKFLLNYKTESLMPMISVEKYMDFCLKFILAFGLVFELPVVIVFLTRMGLVKIETLAKNRKYAVLFAFVLAAFLTPTPDAFNQTLMAVPIMVLYEGGLLASRVFKKRRAMSDDKG